MARAPARARAPNSDVFINCPFDDDYLPCFEALLFAITIAGYQARCALEENDAGDIRFDKLRRLIADSDYTIHDLSNVELAQEACDEREMGWPLHVGDVDDRRHAGAEQQLGHLRAALHGMVGDRNIGLAAADHHDGQAGGFAVGAELQAPPDAHRIYHDDHAGRA